MSKRRKYDLKNKRSFIIILILSIVIVGIFSLFIYKYSKASKVEYIIEAGSVLQDVEKNYLTIDDDVVLKIRWNGTYYLNYNDEKINLGKKVIVYNTITGGMKLYGTFYEIASDGKIIEYKNETVLENTTQSKFYKLDDREYLLVDSKIYSDDNSIQTNNYLLVELDKAGNAKLSNNNINLKTISPTILVTSKYTFDIANELLNFGEFDIDLKKIIGSTNQYVPEGSGDSAGTGTGTGDGTDNNGGAAGNLGTGGGIGTGEGMGPGNVVNNNDIGDITDIGEIKDKIKMTSVIRVMEGLSQIDVDYVVYDPYNEYKSVYVEVISDGKTDVVYLSKADTHVTFGDLTANTNYKLNFIYTTSSVDENTGETVIEPYTFESLDLRTKMPEYSISIYKISTVDSVLKYKVDLQSNFNISKINVNMSFDTGEKDKITNESIIEFDDSVIEVDEKDMRLGYAYGTFDISEYSLEPDTLVELTVRSVEIDGFTLEINSTYKFRFGRQT